MLDALLEQGYAPAGDPFPTGRPDRATVPLVAPDGRPVVAKAYPRGGGEEVFAAIRQAIVSEHEVAVEAIVLIKPGTIPKTSSGKIRRAACRG